MLSRFGKEASAERGQMAWAFILMLLFVFMIFAVSLDAGLWFFDHRTAQNQAETGALAAVQELPHNLLTALVDQSSLRFMNEQQKHALEFRPHFLSTFALACYGYQLLSIKLSMPHEGVVAAFAYQSFYYGMLFKMVEDTMSAHHDNIEIRLETEALRLISDGADDEVVGITVRGPGGQSRVRALRGVVLASGGFEGSPAMQEQFWEGRPVLPCAAARNTGDGIRMAQDLGAAIWHMWHFHGAYGFKHTDPSYPYAIRVKRLPDWIPGREATAQVKMAWILLDRDGKRYMNEYQPYTQDTAHRPLHYFDPMIQDYPRIPGYIMCDENGRKLYPLGRPTSNDPDVFYDWSDDNMKEVENGILKRADSVAELAKILGADPAAFEESVARWNACCANGADSDHGRPSGTMVPIDTPPYYGAQAWPVCSNTQGGPVHDGNQSIVDVYGKPIANLYAAGEMGSAFGHLYLSGGNIAECFISGRIAGANAAKAGG